MPPFVQIYLHGVFLWFLAQEHYKYLHELALDYMDKYEIYANFK